MAGIILEIQAALLKEQVDVRNVLKKLLVASNKLGLQDVSDWASAELEGYKAEYIPDYRRVIGRVVGFNGVKWIPIAERNTFKMRQVDLRWEFATIERSGSGPEGCAMVGIDRREEMRIAESCNVPVYQVCVSVDRDTFVSVVDAIENRALTIVNGLEKAGIRGDGMSFTGEEIEKARKINSMNITINATNVSGVIGEGNTSGNITFNSDYRSLSADLADYLGKSQDLVNAGSQSDIDQAIEASLNEVRSPEPDRTLVQKTLRAIQEKLPEAISDPVVAGLSSLIASQLS